jgi:hypothetical protein
MHASNPILKQDYAPLQTRYTQLSATSMYNGFIQIMLPPKSPDVWIGDEAYQSEWIHLSLPTRLAPKNATGELVICHKKQTKRIYIWYPIVSNASAVEEDSLDSFLHLYSKDRPLEDTVYLQDWLPDNPEFLCYGNQLFLSKMPIYVQSASLFRKLVWATPSPLFNIVSPFPPVLYQSQTSQWMSGTSSTSISQCGLEGLSLRAIRRREKKRLEAKRARRKKQAEEKEKEREEQEQEEKEDELQSQLPEAPGVEPENDPVEEARHSTLLERLGALTDHVKALSHYITYGHKETAATLGQTGEQIRQTVDGVRQTSTDVQTSKTQLQEMDQKVSEIQLIMRDMANANKIMLNADGSYSKISTIPATPLPATTAPATTASTTNAPPLPTTPLTTAPLPTTTTTTAGISDVLPPVQEGLTTLTEGEDDEFVCHPEGESEEVEMYNIPIGSSFASSLSENATVRMSGAIMSMSILFILSGLFPSAAYRLLKPRFANDQEKKAGGALMAFEIVSIIGFLLLGIVSIGSSSAEVSTIVFLLFMFVIMLAFTFLVVLDKGNTGFTQFDIMPFFINTTSDDLKKLSAFAIFIGAIVFVSLFILYMINAINGLNGFTITKWVLFSIFMAVGYGIVAVNAHNLP